MKLRRGYVALFQYGSNMSRTRLNSPERLHERARRPVGARLDGWGIRFELYSKGNECAVTNIVEASGEYVMGIVYEVPIRLIYAPKGKRSRMDVIEGAQPNGKGNYERNKINVVTAREKKILAATYVGTEAGKIRFLGGDRRVGRTYFDHLLSGAKEFGFSKKYVSYLRRQAGALKN